MILRQAQRRRIVRDISKSVQDLDLDGIVLMSSNTAPPAEASRPDRFGNTMVAPDLYRCLLWRPQSQRTRKRPSMRAPTACETAAAQ
jgi:hypothetical protein